MKEYKNNPLRTLARSDYWQTIYSKSKELKGIRLFDNETDLSAVQMDLLRWLELYHQLELDRLRKEPNISKEVIEDDIRAEAYLIWKNKKMQEEEKDRLKDKKGKKKDKKVRDKNSNIPSVIFRGRK